MQEQEAYLDYLWVLLQEIFLFITNLASTQHRTQNHNMQKCNQIKINKKNRGEFKRGMLE